MTTIAIVLGLLFAGVDTGDWLNSKWLTVIAVAIFFLCRIVWSVDRWMAVAVGYTLLNGLYFGMSPYGYAQHMDVGSRDVLAHHGMRGMIYLLALVIATVNFERIRSVFHSLWWSGIIASTWLLFGSIFDWYLKGPSFNPSMSAVLVAMLIPFMVSRFDDRRKWLMIGLAMSAIISTGSAIGYAAAGAGLLSFFAVSNRHRMGVVYASIGLVGVLSAIAYATLDPQFFAFNGRMETWKATWTYFFDNPMRVPFGFGLGSYYPFSVYIKTLTGNIIGADKVLVTAHNDVLQCMFELGFVGLFAWVVVYARALWFNRTTAFAFSFFVIVGVSTLGNFPHHMGFESFIIACMYRASTKTRTIFVNA